MSITTVGSNLVHYEALGRGKPMIFIHGWLGSWRYWWPSMQTLSAHFRTFALDLWGFGDSSKVSEKYSIEEYVLLLEAFVNRLGIAEPAIIVGHGLGATVALRYAVRNPDSVRRLAASALPLGENALNTRLLSGDVHGIVQRVLERPGSFPEIETEARKTDPAVLRALVQDLDQLDTYADLERVVCPLLLVFGDQDPLVQYPNGDLAIKPVIAKGLAIVKLSSCTHFPMLEQSAKFNRLILDFIYADDDISNLTPKEYWKRRTY